MIVDATPEQTRSILGAMRLVAFPPSAADRSAIDAAYRYLFNPTRGPAMPGS